MVAGKCGGKAHGGRLQSAMVRSTCEVVLIKSSRQLRSEIDPEAGLALIRL